MSLAESRLAEWRARLAEDPTNAELRVEVAFNLVMANHDDEATIELTTLWTEPAGARLRVGVAMRMIQRLIDRHPPARAAFAVLRDRVAPSTEPNREEIRDWTLLNQMLGDEDRSVTWFDTAYPQVVDREAIAEVVERALMRLLVERGRWADAGALLREPLTRIREILPPPRTDPLPFELPPDLAERAASLGGRARTMFAAIFVRALLAANRQDDARAVAAYCRSIDSSQQMDEMLAGHGLPLPS